MGVGTPPPDLSDSQQRAFTLVKIWGGGVPHFVSPERRGALRLTWTCLTGKRTNRNWEESC